MGKQSTRTWAKRELDRANNNIDMAMVHFKNLHERGYEKVPYIKDTIEVATKVLIEVQTMLKRARDRI